MMNSYEKHLNSEELPELNELMSAFSALFHKLDGETVGGQKIKSLCFHIDTHDVSFELENNRAEESDSYEDFYSQYELSFSEEIDSYSAKYNRYLERKFINGVCLEDLEEMRVKELERMLDSGFILEDSVSVNSRKLKESKAELMLLQIENNDRAVRYAILKELFPMAEGRFVFDNKRAIGHYLKENHRRLTEDLISEFFRFKCITQLIYRDLDDLRKEQVENSLSAVDRAIFERILKFIQCGDWQTPATCEKICKWFSTLFGADMRYLDIEDLEKTRQFRDFFKEGSSGADTDRVEVSMADILGYLIRYQLLAGGQEKISHDIFGNSNQVNNLNKGKNLEGNKKFKDLLAFMDKYRERLI